MRGDGDCALSGSQPPKKSGRRKARADVRRGSDLFDELRGASAPRPGTMPPYVIFRHPLRDMVSAAGHARRVAQRAASGEESGDFGDARHAIRFSQNLAATGCALGIV